MKHIQTILLALFMTTYASSQTESYIISRQGSLSIMPSYQRWSWGDNTNFYQFGTTISLYNPMGRQWSFSLRGSPANTGGDVTSLSGFSDTQLGLTYHVEAPDIVMTLGVNFPTGKKELTQDEFLTSVLLSNNVFSLRVPNYGQGFNLNPGLIWAIPVSDEVVLGLGAAYTYKGKFKTLKDYDEYDPGDEIVATAGVDIRVAEVSTLSADLIFTTYGSDKLGADEVFASGNKIVVNGQLSTAFGTNELRLIARYRSKAKSNVAFGGVLVKEEDKVEPDQLEVDAQFGIRWDERYSTRFIAEVRSFEETRAVLSGVTLGGVGIAPAIVISPSVTIQGEIKFQFGTFKDGTKLSSQEASLGLVVKY